MTEVASYPSYQELQMSPNRPGGYDRGHLLPLLQIATDEPSTDQMDMPGLASFPSYQELQVSNKPGEYYRGRLVPKATGE